MNEVSHLVIQVDSDKVPVAEKRLDKMTDSSERSERATGKLAAMSGKLMAALAAVAAVAASASGAFNKIVEVTDEAEKAQARLRAAGIETEAQVRAVFDVLEEMSSKPPFGLEETTDAFVKLVNQGLDPSAKALQAYADLAVGSKSSLEGTVDAIAQAANGQFRSLKQFGVTATAEMDGLVVSFRGNSEKIKGDAASIEQYMQKLSATNFAGAAAAQAETLSGKLYQLSDTWDDVWRAVSNSGVGQIIKDGVDMATKALAELEAMILSGQLESYLSAIGDKFTPFVEAATTAVNFVVDMWNKGMGALGTDTGSVMDFIVRSFVELPENVTAVVKGIGATFGLLVEYAIATGRGVYNGVVGSFKFIYESAKNLGSLLLDLIWNPTKAVQSFKEFSDKQIKSTVNFGQEIKEGWNQTTAAIGNATDAWGGVITEIMDERDTALAGFDAKIKGADAEREAWEKLQEARKNANVANDPLAGAKKGRGKTISEESRAAFEALKTSLMSEEDAVQQSYEKRLAVIMNNTEAGSALRLELEQQLREKMEVEMASAHEGHVSRLESEYQAEQLLLQSALDNRQISETEFRDKSLANWNEYMSKVGKVTAIGTKTVALTTLQGYKMVLDMSSDIAAQLSGLVQNSSGAAKAMFIASKAIAIAQAIVNTEVAATQALTMGPILGVPASTMIRALGYSSVGLIAATAIQEFQGKFEHGGMIGSGRYGLVGEAGAELVRGPAVVTSARQTADMGSARGGNTSINVHNYSGAEVQTQERDTLDGKVFDVIIKRLENKIASSIASGGTPVARAMETAYGVNRANQR